MSRFRSSCKVNPRHASERACPLLCGTAAAGAHGPCPADAAARRCPGRAGGSGGWAAASSGCRAPAFQAGCQERQERCPAAICSSPRLPQHKMATPGGTPQGPPAGRATGQSFPSPPAGKGPKGRSLPGAATPRAASRRCHSPCFPPSEAQHSSSTPRTSLCSPD